MIGYVTERYPSKKLVATDYFKRYPVASTKGRDYGYVTATTCMQKGLLQQRTEVTATVGMQEGLLQQMTQVTGYITAITDMQ